MSSISRYATTTTIGTSVGSVGVGDRDRVLRWLRSRLSIFVLVFHPNQMRQIRNGHNTAQQHTHLQGAAAAAFAAAAVAAAAATASTTSSDREVINQQVSMGNFHRSTVYDRPFRPWLF